MTDAQPSMTDATAPPRAPHAAGRPTRDQASALADRIVDAATQLITKNGYQATSIDAIAREAGVAKRTFYSRFEGKEELLVAVLRRLVAEVVPPMRVETGAVSLREQLEAFGNDLVACSTGPIATGWRRLIINELVHAPDLAALVRRETVEVIDGFVATVLRDAVRCKHLPDIDIDFASRSYRALLCAPFQDPTVCGGDVPPGHVRDAVAFFLRGCGAMEDRSDVVRVRRTAAPRPAAPGMGSSVKGVEE